jgi:two-component sensor histidine kinase
VSVVVSELVTNAVQLGAGCGVIGIEASGPQVVVSVADGSAVVPRRREPDGRGGRGLVLVEALTRRWHVEEHEGGKRVRAELRAYPGTGRELP